MTQMDDCLPLVSLPHIILRGTLHQVLEFKWVSRVQKGLIQDLAFGRDTTYLLKLAGK